MFSHVTILLFSSQFLSFFQVPAEMLENLSILISAFVIEALVVGWAYPEVLLLV